LTEDLEEFLMLLFLPLTELDESDIDGVAAAFVVCISVLRAFFADQILTLRAFQGLQREYLASYTC